MEISSFFTFSYIIKLDFFHLKAWKLQGIICVSFFSFPFGIFSLLVGQQLVKLSHLLLVLVQMIVQSCLVLSRDGNAGEVWLLQKSMETVWNLHKFHYNLFFLIVRQTTDQWSLKSSKAVVSPHKIWQCIFPSFRMMPGERDILF